MMRASGHYRAVIGTWRADIATHYCVLELASGRTSQRPWAGPARKPS
ncbi:MAG: hypothetical protein QW452_01960 [Pyrobaculum sp.]